MTKRYTIEQLNHHLDYEISMLNASYQLIPIIYGCLAIEDDNLRRAARNAMIESFCVHARALEEFFDDSGENTAKGQSDGLYKIADKLPKDLIRKLNNQMAHLKEGRTDVDADKLQEIDWEKLFRWVSKKLSEFKVAMEGKGLRVRDVDLSLIPAKPPIHESKP